MTTTALDTLNIVVWLVVAGLVILSGAVVALASQRDRIAAELDAYRADHMTEAELDEAERHCGLGDGIAVALLVVLGLGIVIAVGAMNGWV